MLDKQIGNGQYRPAGEDLFTDLSFEAARTWKAAKPGRKVIGFMPYYVPREISTPRSSSARILGGGDQL